MKYTVTLEKWEYTLLQDLLSEETERGDAYLHLNDAIHLLGRLNDAVAN